MKVISNKWLIVGMIIIFTFSTKAMAQTEKHMYRIAKIQVDPAQLEKYINALKEQMTTAIRVEPGVLSYYAVADKANPSEITIFEIYADSAAYKAHLQAPHFKRYKELVQHMVMHLDVIDVDLIGSSRKPNL